MYKLLGTLVILGPSIGACSTPSPGTTDAGPVVDAQYTADAVALERTHAGM